LQNATKSQGSICDVSSQQHMRIFAIKHVVRC